MRSQRHLRELNGYDSGGRTAYQFGQASRLTAANQWAKARQAGFLPPAVSPAPVFTISTTGGETPTATLTFAGAGAVAGSQVLVNWGDGAPTEWVTIGITRTRTYATSGSKTITATLSGAVQTTAFTATVA